MDNKEWKQYVETGNVTIRFLKAMAQKIKDGDKLNAQYLAVYQTHSDIIELLLSKISKTK